MLTTNLFAAESFEQEKKIIHQQCLDIGFKNGTTEIANCKLQLLILHRQTLQEERKILLAEITARAAEANVAASEAIAKAQKSIAKDSSARAADAMIKRGQGLMNGTCTFSNLSSC